MKKRKMKAISIIMVFAMVFTVFAIPGTAAAADTKANTSNNEITVPENVIAGSSFTIKAAGANQEDYTNNTGTVGETAYVPSYISMTGTDDYDIGNTLSDSSFSVNNGYSVTALINRAYTETVTVTFEKYEYSNGNGWADTGTSTNKSINVAAKGTLKFNGNGGKVAFGTKYLFNGATRGTAPKAKKSGYKLMGWYPSKKSRKKITSGTKINFYSSYYEEYYLSKTLYAKWTKKVKVKFSANKGRVSKKSKTVKSNYKYGKLPTPKRSGYKFKGWYTKKSGGTRITKNTYVSKTKNILYMRTGSGQRDMVPQ